MTGQIIRVFADLRRLPFLVVAAVGIACEGSGVLEPTFDPVTGQFRFQSPAHPRLLQLVRLTPLTPAPGDTLRIEALLVNRGQSPAVVEARTCGLTTRGTLTLRDSFIRCAGYSGRGTIAPGDTVRGFDMYVVGSGAGDYTLDVLHVVDPEVWVRMPVSVRRR